MTEEIAELQGICDEIASDQTRLEAKINDVDDNLEACFKDCKRKIRDNEEIVLSRLEELVRSMNENNAKFTKAIRILDGRVNILKDASNLHAQVLAAKFPEIKRVHIDEKDAIAPERGKTGPN